MVNELHAVLEQANLPGPYVLVGHSLGGLNMRLYATQYGASGLVFIDATSENQDSRYWSLLPPDALASFREMLRASPEGLDYAAFEASLAQVRVARRSLANVPLIVLTHGRPDSRAAGRVGGAGRGPRTSVGGPAGGSAKVLVERGADRGAAGGPLHPDGRAGGGWSQPCCAWCRARGRSSLSSRDERELVARSKRTGTGMEIRDSEF